MKGSLCNHHVVDLTLQTKSNVQQYKRLWNRDERKGDL